MNAVLRLERPERLETLNEISRVVSATLDLSLLYETIYKQIGRVMDASQFFIALHVPGETRVSVPYLREEGNLFRDVDFDYGGNTTSLVIETGRPLLYNTAEEFLDFANDNGVDGPLLGEKDSEAGIFVPLNTGRRTIGALTVQSLRRHVYTEDDVQMLSVIASQAAVAIENARLYARSQTNVQQMQALLRVAQLLNASLDLKTVLDSILAGMWEVVPYYFAAILLPDEDKEQLRVAGAQGPDEARPKLLQIRDQIRVPFGQGITGRVFETGEPLLVPDVTEHDEYFDHGLDGILSELAVPLKRGDAVVGVLDVERVEAGAFTHEDRDWLSLFASQAAIAIENARLFEQQQSRVSELQTVQKIVQKLTPLHDVPAIATVIDQELKQLIDFHACRMFRLDDEDQMLVYINSSAPTSIVRMPVWEGFTGWIATNAQSLLIPNTLEDSRGAHVPGTPYRVESLVGAPMIYEGRVQGVVTLTRLGANQFDENSRRLLEIVAAQAAIVFDRARLYEELHEQAVTDDLTKLFNRRYLMDRFREEKSRAVRNGHSLAAIMVDIDSFKRVNDCFGHAAGDVVLRSLARVIRAVARAEDVVVRYGGEEFCLLLPEVDLDDAQQVAERLRGLIERSRLPAEAGVRGVTVSIGVAVLQPTDQLDELFSLADDAMYIAKRQGGNLVSVASINGESWDAGLET